MKRVRGIWYVKYLGVWLPAGKTVRGAFEYAGCLLSMKNALDKIRQVGIY